MKKIIVAILLLALSIPLKVSHAFWSDPFYGTHQDITKTALSLNVKTALPPFCFSPADCYAFSANAITQINNRHLKQDVSFLTSIGYGVAYDPNDHFDSNHLSQSLTKMANNRGQLNTLLKTGTFSPATQAKMWALMGNMLHAVEDFYAHSTWVDEGNSGNSIIGFGAATESTSTPNNSIFPVSSLTTYCGPSGYPLSALPVNYVITGFYPNPAAPAGGATPAGGCAHGSTLAFLRTCNGPPTVPGIAHDIACSGDFIPADTELLHQIAYSLAVQEAQSFVQSIIADVVSANNAAGFCALLDLPANTQISSTQMCGGPILSANPSWVVAGAKVTFSLVVGMPNGSATIPTGTAVVMDELGNVVCSITLNSTSTGTCSYVYPLNAQTASHTFTAKYSGDKAYPASHSPSITTAPYTVKAIAPPSGDYIFEAKGVNSSGDFVGLACAPQQQCDFNGVPTVAFINHDGQYFDLDTLAPSINLGSYTTPQAISESGSVLTISQPAPGSNAAQSVFLLTRTADSPLSYSATLLAPPSGDYIFEARGVNSSGDFVGLACAPQQQCDFNGVPTVAFINHDGQYFDLDTLAPSINLGSYTTPQAISESGSVLTISQPAPGSNAAQSVFLLTRTADSPLSYSATLLAPPSGDYIFEARGVNSSGDFVGLACAPQQQCDFNGVPTVAFINHDGQYFDLDTLAPSINLGSYTTPQAISESGSVLTISQPAPGSNAAQSVVLLAAPYLPSFSIVATVAGLNGSLTLQNSDGNTVSVSGTVGSTIAVFPAVPSGSTYAITIASSKQTCSVSNGSGVVSAALVTNVSVTCN